MISSTLFLGLGLEDSIFVTESLCYKLGVWGLKDVGVYQAGWVEWRMLSSCIKGNVGSSVFRAWPTLRTESQDIPGSVVSMLTIFFLVCLLWVSQHYENAILNRWSTLLTTLLSFIIESCLVWRPFSLHYKEARVRGWEMHYITECPYSYGRTKMLVCVSIHTCECIMNTDVFLHLRVGELLGDVYKPRAVQSFITECMFVCYCTCVSDVLV